MIMNLKDCYIKFGGDFEEVLGRLRREQIVQKFVYKFLHDKSFHLLEASMENKDHEEALRAVHTLKGICQNLSFTRLFESSSLVTKALRENDWNKAVDMMPKLSKDYYEIINVIEDFKNSKEE
ncbi:hypothetical protein AR1Y2_1699 [Anaerostipes rhamnosivorans]|jgi:HPt (histidine-containing phosphotransfer) domain-containing protein|uniref:HPt domain-containing protein n=2 Tax=Anaerostipes rhamnosivorans TaxID=1229621 RepID=A0A4P8IGR3_9FIRM|nr:hypothetical protein AR1Y2_1699 [Anaerostipes rhamnosivorans]